MKINCWEFTKCGRQPGGEKNGELGICTVTTEKATHGINNGINGGRACWAVRKKMNGNAAPCSCATHLKKENCLLCEFYAIVRREESGNFVSATEILSMLKAHRNGDGAGIGYGRNNLMTNAVNYCELVRT